MPKIIVVGGGIGGLAAALAIGARGHEVLVLERAQEFAEIGAGIQLAPNGLYALERLGVARTASVPMDELRLMDGLSGEHVTSLPLTERYQRRFGKPYAVVHRAELHRALLDRCAAQPGISLRSAHEAVGYTQDADSVTVVLATGERITADGLIGADGIHSAIRAQLVGDGAPVVSGITVHRAIVPMSQVPTELRMDRSVVWWVGPGGHLVHYPIASGTSLNLAASFHDGGTRPFAGVETAAETVRERFAAFGARVQALLALGRGWKSWMLIDREPVHDWADGRVVLLGDAAHPMIHYAAQGACVALEDAVALGDLLDCGTAALPARFEEYTGLRRERAAAVQRAARWSTALWHPSGEAARARNALLSGLSEDQLHDHVAWMHGVRDPLRDSHQAHPYFAKKTPA